MKLSSLAAVALLLFSSSAVIADDVKIGPPEPPITEAPTSQPTTQPSAPFKPQVLPKDVATNLQDVSVMIKTGSGTGSGVIVTRDGVNYVWTAAHVVEGNRKVREVIDTKTGGTRNVVEFSDVQVVSNLSDGGRTVGQLSMDAEVVRYSDADTGEDLALLRIRKKNYVNVSAQFYLGETIPTLGTQLIHVGSMHGQIGSNSMTTGIVAQIGRVLLDKQVVFDQTTVTAFPGSSGGGVFLQDGRYYGMLVRGGTANFNFVVPMRRLSAWADRVGIRFAIDENSPIPTEKELRSRPVEDSGTNVEFNGYRAAAEAPKKPTGEAKKKLSTEEDFFLEPDNESDVAHEMILR